MFTKSDSRVRLALADNVSRNRKAQKLPGGKSWSQAKLAEECGVSLGTIQKIEAGASWPDWKTVLKISNVLGVHVDSLYTQERIVTDMELEVALKVVNAALNIDLRPPRVELHMDKEFFFESLKAEVQQVEKVLPSEVHTALDGLVKKVIEAVG